MYDSLDQAFAERTEAINSIFSSYRSLYDIYLGALRTLKANQNTIQAIENAKKTVDKQQKKISGQLYSQGFILLTGAAEALLKDVFVCLLKENFNQINELSSINFSARELQDILTKNADNSDATHGISSDLGELTVKKLYSSKNPIEKINFQNVETTKQVLSRNFGIELIDSDYLKHIHRHWQVRHTLIHNNGVIDDRFIHNVRIVGLLLPSERSGSAVMVTKKIFSEANEDFLKFFNELDQLIDGTKLHCSMLAPRTKDEEDVNESF